MQLTGPIICFSSLFLMCLWQITWFMQVVYGAWGLRSLLTGLKCGHILPWLTCRVSSLCLFQSSLEQRSGWTSTSRMQTGERPKAISPCFYPSSGLFHLKLAINRNAANCWSELLEVKEVQKHRWNIFLSIHSMSFTFHTHLLLHSGLQGSDRTEEWHPLLCHSYYGEDKCC